MKASGFCTTTLLICEEWIISCSHRWQNGILLLASYIFYATWDYRFLALILSSTAINYFAGEMIYRCDSGKSRKTWLWLSVLVNLGILGFFKYFNFFLESLSLIFNQLGLELSNVTINIVLPVGISFYTFQTMSYTIDIYRKKLKPVDSFSDFALYVAFFPQLVAGPIERATNLLPQICKRRTLHSTMLKTSFFLFFFGLFEKVVVADNLSNLVSGVYGNSQSDGLEVLIATYGFAFQIFADFDGYSNMAKGMAGLMGFKLMNNFNAPYFSCTPSEFWNRWHISLSSWLRDYLYIPLGGNRGTVYQTARNLFLTMFLGGLWHGASWMFVLWGVFHGLLLVIYLPLAKAISDFPLFSRQLLFFHLVCIGWIFFRAEDTGQLLFLTGQLFGNFDLQLDAGKILLLKKLILYASVPFLYQYLQFKKNELCPLFSWPTGFRAISYAAIFYMIVIFGFNSAQSFIYFQF